MADHFTFDFFIRHKQYRDICWKILNRYKGTGYVKYKVELWNMGYVKSWPMGIKDYIDIKDEDRQNWLEAIGGFKNTSCLRNEHWINLEAKT